MDQCKAVDDHHMTYLGERLLLHGICRETNDTEQCSIDLLAVGLAWQERVQSLVVPKGHLAVDRSDANVLGKRQLNIVSSL